MYTQQAHATESLENVSFGNNSDLVTINSRFGEIEINLQSKILFEKGILGLPESINFCLADYPRHNMEHFKLLQCVEDQEFCFITIPAEYNNVIIDKQDLDVACKTLGISKDSLLILFIVTVHKQDGKTELSINSMAPIMVDVVKRAATQYVMQNPKYTTKYVISKF